MSKKRLVPSADSTALAVGQARLDALPRVLNDAALACLDNVSLWRMCAVSRSAKARVVQSLM